MKNSAKVLLMGALLGAFPPGAARADVTGHIRFPSDPSRMSLWTATCTGHRESMQGVITWTLQTTPGARYSITNLSPYEAIFDITFYRQDGCPGGTIGRAGPAGYVPSGAILGVVTLRPMSWVQADPGFQIWLDGYPYCIPRPWGCEVWIERYGDPHASLHVQPPESFAGASFVYAEEL